LAATGATEEIEFPNDVEPLKIPLERAVHELRSISIPDISRIKVISTEDGWRNEALDIYEWLGLASLRAKRITTTNRVDSYVSVYHSPEPNTQGTGCMIRWSGFIPTFLLENILTLLRNNIKLAQVPWASFTVWGFQDSPVSWRRQEHGYLISGENHYTFVMWPDETYVLYQQLGTLDAYS